MDLVGVGRGDVGVLVVSVCRVIMHVLPVYVVCVCVRVCQSGLCEDWFMRACVRACVWSDAERTKKGCVNSEIVQRKEERAEESERTSGIE